jgi:hypothetical protein
LTLLATVAAAGLASYAAPARASDYCPAIGVATGCNLVITFAGDGSVTTGAGTSPGTYDGSDDTLIGVVNNTSSALTSFNISSTLDIFGFDGDGIDGYHGDGIAPVGNNPDTQGYGGPDGYFTNITDTDGVESGTVNFANGGIAAGGSDFFSLEEAISVDQAPSITPAPEPATMAILGVGMLGAAAARRFRRKA